MTIDPQLREVITSLGQLTHADLMVSEGLERLLAVAATLQADAPTSVHVSNDTVPGPHGPVPVRIYQPLGEQGVKPALIWLHGGAWIAGDLDMPEADYPPRFLSAAADIVVISVDYRLALDGVHFPVPNDDVLAVVQWVRFLTTVDPTNVYLGGASAGGNLSAGVALRLKDEGQAILAGLVLIYPLLHPELPPLDAALHEQLAELPAVLRFPPDVLTPLVENFLGVPVQEAHPHAFPALGDVTGLPPTFVLVAEYDDLRTSGEEFAAKLDAAGVPVTLICEPGVPHGHLNYPRLDATTRSLTEIAKWLGTRITESPETA